MKDYTVTGSGSGTIEFEKDGKIKSITGGSVTVTGGVIDAKTGTITLTPTVAPGSGANPLAITLDFSQITQS